MLPNVLWTCAPLLYYMLTNIVWLKITKRTAQEIQVLRDLMVLKGCNFLLGLEKELKLWFEMELKCVVIIQIEGHRYPGSVEFDIEFSYGGLLLEFQLYKWSQIPLMNACYCVSILKFQIEKVGSHFCMTSRKHLLMVASKPTSVILAF